MAVLNLNVNGQKREVDVDPNTPILWVLRDNLDLVGTKYGCGVAMCGACTVHLDGTAIRSCQVPVSAVGNKKITTIEGLSEKRGSPRAKSVVGTRCGPVRLLPGRADHVGVGPVEVQSEAHR